MQQPPDLPPPAQAPAASDEFERALAAIGEAIEGLDGLGLADERGRVVVEPAAALHWS